MALARRSGRLQLLVLHGRQSNGNLANFQPLGLRELLKTWRLAGSVA